MLHPLGKYLVVEPIEEEKTSSGILVPEDVVFQASAFTLVKILEPHIESELMTGMKVLVPTHMVEEASFFGKTYYLVTENSVIGFYAEENK